MIRIPAADGKTYRVPSWTTFASWRKHVAYAYVILAIAGSIGIYTFSQKGSQDLKNQVNRFATEQCLINAKPHSALHKYNDLVQNLIETRQQSLAKDKLIGDKKSEKVDRNAIVRYKTDFLPIPTKEQCLHPILK